MRTLFLQLLLVSTAMVAVADDKGAYNGKWQVRQNIAGNESSQTCTFAQTGTDLSGSCGSNRGTLQISGKVDDRKAVWSFKTEYNGSPLTVRYEGAMDAQNKITGTVTVDEFSVSGDFSATPAK